MKVPRTVTNPLPGESALPTQVDAILLLAAQSLFDVFDSASEGMLLVDKSGRVVWINDQYRRYLPALGFKSEDEFVGNAVLSVVHNTEMDKVLTSGKPIFIDLLTNKAGTFVVSRFPLKDASGEVIGALGIVLFDQPAANLQPLMAKFALLQRDLDEARQALALQTMQLPQGPRRAKHTFASFMGSSPAAIEVKRQARRAAQSSSPVLLLGETGTGKELLAHAIHAVSPRASGPLVSVNIAAIPDNLLEAEFFGVVPGAYTGADRKGRDGKFKLADRGTLFLDEIGDMPLVLQAKLLRALQEGEVEPLGSNQVVSFDVRIIAATSRDMAALVRAGKFREDLFYRLNVLPIRVPALRERASDIAGLVEVLGEELAIKTGVAPSDLSPQALDVLVTQEWRGNVRELRNVLEQIMLRSDTPRIGVELVQQILRESGSATWAQTAPTPTPVLLQTDVAQTLVPLAQQVAALEKSVIAQAMHATRGNKVAAAAALGISRAKLYERLGSFGPKN